MKNNDSEGKPVHCQGTCFACRDRESGGLGLRFEVQEDKSVFASFDCDPWYQSYTDRVHGGIASLLVDAAMTHCMFAHGIRAVTARLQMKFRHPIRLSMPASIRAWMERASGAGFVLKAEIVQNEQICVTGESIFCREPSLK